MFLSQLVVLFVTETYLIRDHLVAKIECPIDSISQTRECPTSKEHYLAVCLVLHRV